MWGMAKSVMVNLKMDISDLHGQHKVPELSAEVIDFEDSRDTKIGLVESWKISDKTGECLLTLFKEQVGTVGVGDKIIIENGWCTVFQDKIQVSPGKYGKLQKEEGA
jgi:ssDNA-binding replication factor A large subunit